MGIIVGGVDLGGMVVETNVRDVQSQSGGIFYAIVVLVVVVVVVKGRRGSLPPSVTTCGGDQWSSYDLAIPLFPCWGHFDPRPPDTAITVKLHAAHRPGNRRGGSPLRLSRRSLQKLYCAFGKTIKLSTGLSVHLWISRSRRTTGGGGIFFVCREKIKISSKESDTGPG